jgi:hypothetical protein
MFDLQPPRHIPTLLKTRPFVSRSHGSFRQLRTFRKVDVGRQWAKLRGNILDYLLPAPITSTACMTSSSWSVAASSAS